VLEENSEKDRKTGARVLSGGGSKKRKKLVRMLLNSQRGGRIRRGIDFQFLISKKEESGIELKEEQVGDQAPIWRGFQREETQNY